VTVTDYRNFDLLVTRAGERYRAFVVDAPAGEASIVFDPPFAAGEFTRLGGLMGLRRDVRPEDGRPPAADLADLGSRLFAAIFRDEVRSLLAASLSSVAEEGAGLRLRLRFEEDAADLAILPWEILYDADHSQFVGLGEASPILRYLSLPRSRSALLVEPPLRVLALLSSPVGLPELDVEREWQAIQEALGALVRDGKFVLEQLTRPTLNALQERLLDEPVHVLHIVSHGVFDERSQAGSVALEDAQGQAHLVRGDELAKLLRNHPAVRLSYLSACEGALASGASVFTGVAQALVQGGVPAAVAMQAEISDSGAIEMARIFYTALAAGRPVDAALTQARVSLSAAGSPEWAIPVLFSRSPDNRLFDIRQVLPTPDCPYPGMSPFSEGQEAFFFGRDRETEAAIEHLRQHPFLAIVGPSGSGKSSLVYAGVIPALRRARRFGPGKWAIQAMRPSDNRTAEGKAAPRAALARLLDCAPGALAGATFEQRTLLFVDQFEELFTLAEPGEAQAFLDALQGLMGRPNLYLLLTVRADFYPDLMACSLWQPIRRNRLELPPLGDDELWAAIVEPAARVGVTVGEALAVKLIADASAESGALPLVQETLVQLWDKVSDRQLPLAAYREMAEGGRSGLQVAIDRRASLVYDNLPEAAQPLARRTFLRLIQFGEGRADTRRQQTVAELRASGDDPALFDRTVARLTESRLLTASGDPEGGARRIDIAHEALIAGWPRLQAWLEQRRAAEQARRRLEGKAAEWVRADKRGRLLDEYELLEAERWLGTEDARELGHSQDLADLVQASKEAIAQARAEKRAQRQRELEQAQKLAEEQRLRAEEGDRAASRLRRRLVVITVAVAIALVAFVAATWFGVDADRQRDHARTALVTATMAQGQAEIDADKAVKAAATATAALGQAEIQADNAVRAAATATAALGQAEIEADNAVRAAATAAVAQGQAEIEARNAAEARETAEANAAEAERQKQEAERAARRAQSGELAVHAQTELANKTDASGSLPLILAREAVLTTWASDGVVMVNADAALRAAVDAAPPYRMTLRGHSGYVTSAAYSPDGQFIVTASSDGTARIWNAVTGQEVHTLNGHSGYVTSAAYRPDGQFIVTASLDGTARIWNAATGEQVLPPLSGHTGRVRSAAYSPNGDFIVTAGDDGARIWRADTGQEVLPPLSGHTGWVRSAAYSPDGQFIVTASEDETARIWNAATGQEVRMLSGHAGRVNSAAYSPDGQFIVTAGADGTARIWNAADGVLVRTLSGHAHEVASAAYSPDGQTIVTASYDATARIWDATEGVSVRTLSGHTYEVTSAAYSPDGRTIVTASYDRTARIWNAVAGEDLRTLSGHTGRVRSAAYSPNGDFIVTAGDDQTARIWDAATGEEVRTLSGHTGRVWSAAYSPDGDFIVTASEDETARIWNAATGQEVGTLSGHTYWVRSAAYSPDGQFIVTAGDDRTARIWNAATGEELHTLSGHADRVWSATYSPDGRTIVTASYDATARIWDAARGEEVRTLNILTSLGPVNDGQLYDVTSVAYSPDGNFIVAAGADGTARIWDAAAGQEVRTLSGHTSGVNSAAYSPDGLTIVTAGDDGTARIWDADTGEALRTLTGHSRAVNGAAYSPDGRFIVAASDDGTARIWFASIDDLLAEVDRLIQREPPLLTPEERWRYGLE